VNARLLLLLALFTAMPAAARGQSASTPGVIVDATPVLISPTAKVPLTTLPRNTDVTVLSVQEGWVQVAFEDPRFGRRVGYVLRSSVSFVMPGGTPARPTVASASPTPSAFPASAPAATLSAPAVRPSVRSVESEFPASSATPSAVKAAALPIATDLFPDATGAPVSSPVRATAASAPAPGTQPSLSALDSRTVTPLDVVTSHTRRPSVSPKRGMPVTLLIPRGLLHDDDDHSLRRGPVLVADVTAPARESTAVNGSADWMRAGLPSMLEASVSRIVEKKDHTDIELQATGAENAGLIVTLRFSGVVPDPEGALGQLIVEGSGDGSAARTYRREAHAELANTVFGGDLRSLPDDRKLSILDALQDTPGADVSAIGGGVYASFDLGVDSRLFDPRSSDVATIVGFVLRETVLPELQKKAKALTSVPELRGIRVVYRIPHQAASRSSENEYRLELVADMTDAIAFAMGSSNGEALINAATIRVDGKSVHVTLPPSSTRAAR
jgi:hypothetical protein